MVAALRKRRIDRARNYLTLAGTGGTKETAEGDRVGSGAVRFLDGRAHDWPAVGGALPGLARSNIT